VEQLLSTKLYIPPLRSDLVSRPQLTERLSKATRRKLTLVSAPAGFGKSTLVRGWLAESVITAAWLSLDEGDNDPVRFWRYIIAAFQVANQEFGAEALQIISEPQLRSTEPVAISLINDISQLTHELILVLDDYHVIDAGQIHEGLSYLLDHQPTNLHIVLITRVDPVLSLARLRAHGRMIEIRAVDLQFSADEAAILFNDVMDLDLKVKQIEALNQRTEGWIVGLQLAALSLKGHPSYETFIEQFTGSHHYILDYLTEEVLGKLPDAQRAFLLRTSHLGRFCSELCSTVTGDDASMHLLEEIQKGNLFLISLDTDGGWFRYHHLFAEVLRALLERDHPDELMELHSRAAAWFESEGHVNEAVDHALRSGDMENAKELILRHWQPTMNKGEVATVLRWLDALPEGMSREDPALGLACCWTLFISGQSPAIAPHLECANEAYERLVSEGILNGEEQSLVASQLYMMRSVLSRSQGEHAAAVAHAERAAHLLPSEMKETAGAAWNILATAHDAAGDFESAIEVHGRGIELAYTTGDLFGIYWSTRGRAGHMLIQGRLREAEGICRPAIDRAVREGHAELPVTAWLHIAMASIELERYCLDKAEAYLNDGLRIARPGGLSEIQRLGQYIRAYLSAARGDQDDAVDTLMNTERIVVAMGDPYAAGELNREWALLYLNRGELDSAREKLTQLEKDISATQNARLKLARNWLTARMLCAEGRYDEALTELEGAIRHTRSTNSLGELIRLLALQAVAMQARYKLESAQSALREAVELAAPEGFIRRWVDAGPRIGSLLRDLRDHSDTPREWHSYLDLVLNACRSAFGATALQPEVEMLDTLTERELEILRLICAGYSNPEIAKELVVTLNTVKKHTSNIYSKLGVRSRTQAIARAHDLDLV
jgi:LuxR family maltose regulon positive regulatory protein